MGVFDQKTGGAVRTVCFTGHRQIPFEVAARLPELLENVIADLHERGAVAFRTGGAMGFDTLAALKVLDMRKKFPDIRLELILPCRNQTDRWDAASKQTYHYIMREANHCRFLYDTYFEGCMLERDRRLVAGSDVCVAYCAHNQGGTAYTFACAMKEGLEVVNLHDFL